MDKLTEKRNLLKEQVRELLPQPGMLQTGIKGFSVSLRIAPTYNQHCFYKPMAILVLQGKKQAILGADNYTYHENQLVVTSIDIPTVGSILEATSEKPFMTLVLELDNYLISQLVSEVSQNLNVSPQRGMGMIEADEEILDAFNRLLLLSRQPERAKVLAPMAVKEIHYLLLTSPIGNILQSVNTSGSRNHQIAEAITWLKKNFREPLRVNQLAQKFNMAESSFYRHFTKVTSISPLQYQKQLRLYEAQRLMLSENFDAATAAYDVGYESASQFNREYKRMFGMPPKTNIIQLKQVL